MKRSNRKGSYILFIGCAKKKQLRKSEGKKTKGNAGKKRAVKRNVSK